MHETHTGVVVLVGDRAYKAKKPVKTDFLDFRTVEQREHACRREVELNSRLSPGSYLGVGYLSDPAGGAAEPVVVMRRYRDEDRLASLANRAESDEVVRGVLDTIAGVLARFHDHAQRGLSIDARGEPGAIEQLWRENLSELHRHGGTTVTDESIGQIEHLVGEFLRGRGLLFTRRIGEGRIVDGHGDLLADDIFCVDDGPALLDCLEFDDELRRVDRIDDAAFLAMDLEFLGRKDLGQYFLQRYVAHSGDPAPMPLCDFYIAYRAVVRAKTDCVRLSQGKAEAAAHAARHLDIARQHLQDGTIRLALVGGSPGTGKSSLARGLAEQVGAQVISTDDVRRELQDWGAISGETDVVDAGLYAPANVAAVYEVALRRARLCLSSGRSVILDATWRDPQMRAQAYRIASETHSALVELQCTVPIRVASDRISAREPGNSDATPEIAATLAAQHHGWHSSVRIDTSKSHERALHEARIAWCQAVELE
ncbi:AAA family ATPase [Mycobacterium basiliense]|nr:bifunctional aminoglycoside phosphotransferase/ATP-binding protein [Mycobacterium basiliense]